MTIFVQDTFTGTSTLAAHTGETGATWTIDPVVGDGNTSELIVTGGEFMKAAAATGETAAYPSGTVTGDFTIEFPIRFVGWSAGVKDGDVYFYDATNTVFAAIGTSITAYLAGLGTAAFSPTPGTTYTVRFESVSGVWTLKVDGGTLLTGSALSITHPISLSLYDRDGSQVARMASYTIESAGPPPPASDFWTSFVGSHEIP